MQTQTCLNISRIYSGLFADYKRKLGGAHIPNQSIRTWASTIFRKGLMALEEEVLENLEDSLSPAPISAA